MSLMLKLLTATLLFSSIATATAIGEKVESYLEDEFGANPQLDSLEVKVAKETPLKELHGWSAFIVAVQAHIKGKAAQTIEQNMMLFSNGVVITQDLRDVVTGESYRMRIEPPFSKSYYRKENLVSGSEKSKHKVAIFSDPLCPFCREFTPAALQYMKKDPKKFALYYYHCPLLRIHPASAVIVRAAVVAKKQGFKNVLEKIYSVTVDAREKDKEQILKAFNKVVGSKVTAEAIKQKDVITEIAYDERVARNIFLGGTPTIYIDGKIDKTRKLYKSIK